MRENKAKVKRIVAKATKQIEIGQKITFGNYWGVFRTPKTPLATGLSRDVNSGIISYNTQYYLQEYYTIL